MQETLTTMNAKKPISYCLGLLALFLTTTSFAVFQEETGSATATYSPRGFTGKPKSEDYNLAIRIAKINALSQLVASLTEADRLNYEKVKATVESDLDRFVPESIVLSQTYDRKAKVVKVVLRASINKSLIDSEIRKVSTVTNTVNNERSMFCIMYVAREQAEVTKFDDTVVKADRTEKSVDEFEEVSSNGVASSVQAEIVVDNRKTTAGKTTIKAQAVTYQIFDSESIDAIFSEVLGVAGFRCIPGRGTIKEKSGGLVDITQHEDDYKTGQRISSESLANAVKGCGMFPIKYLSTGTLTVNAVTKDAGNGGYDASVIVYGKVYKLGGIFEEEVASVQAGPISAFGKDESNAKAFAIKKAAKVAADQIVSQLRLKGEK